MSDANGPASQESASQRDDRRAAREERREAHESQRVVGDLKSQKVHGGAERVLTRTTSGAIYAITILVCLYLGPIATDLLVAAMSWLCCSEFFRIIRMGGRMPNEFIGLAFAVAFPVSVLLHGSVMLFLLFCLVF
ncbi:MAG: phosphatidate cytidylyltransferase, partial [Atopobiaceae bacterium]|nr:phosphatidate cytidylyltransferase [Atopobiaceae bacterium]